MNPIRQNKNILIVGGGGFVGRTLAARLIGSNNRIFLTARKKNLKFPGAKTLYGDLSDKLFCQEILKNIDIVYYLAGYKKNLAFHTKKPFDFIIGNVAPFLNFLDALKTSKVKILVYLSSIIVEYMDLRDQNIDGYVWGKHINELVLKSFAKQSNTDVKIVRSAPIYGPGDNFNPEVANFIPALIHRIYNSSYQLVVWGRGKRKLQFIYIDDLVRNLISISNQKRDFFVCGNPQVLNINEVAKIIISLSGKRLKIRNDISKPDKPTKFFRFSNAVKPRIGLKEGLRRTVAYYKNLNV